MKLNPLTPNVATWVQL